MNILLVINFLGFCLGLIACSILLFANKSHRHANGFLAISLAGLTLLMLQGILLLSGYYVIFPHLFRSFSPVYYLVMPAAYLYVRSILLDQTRLKKWDFVHFVPAVLHFFELIPWYSMNATAKRELIERFLHTPDFVVQLNEGMLPAYAHNMIRGALAVIYLIEMHRLLKRNASSKEGSFKIVHSTAFQWLRTFCYLLTFLVVFFLATFLLPAIPLGRTNTISILISSIFIVINFFLFAKPQILYGIPHIDHKNQNLAAAPGTVVQPGKVSHEVDNPGSVSMHLEQELETAHSALDYLDDYKPLIENHLSKTKPFLKPGYSLIQLSTETGIPRHHLSALINKCYGVRFNDFINRYRIQYITENLNDPRWPNLTLEGIAREAGFNSRTTFFNSIKKFTGLAPSDFLEKARNNQVNLSRKDALT